jgi:hypothetical protein
VALYDLIVGEFRRPHTSINYEKGSSRTPKQCKEPYDVMVLFLCAPFGTKPSLERPQACGLLIFATQRIPLSRCLDYPKPNADPIF